ncbi:NAD(P)-binding protein [Rhizophagus irregularis]|uniref:NAD(P)-binding protein n=1 Tax=Rhizophagus irregularis TaxID=588596 RepID=A0A2N1N4V2_9GLOM|nr:NAD(P)-binding protein [Rhizophagus irregularis]
MTIISNKGVVLKAHPKGMPKVDEHFELVDRTIDIENLKLGENEFVLRNLYLSLDPYVRLTLKEHEPKHERTINKASKKQLVQIGQIIIGAGVSEIIKTNNPNFKVGDLVYALNLDLLKDIPLSYFASFIKRGGLAPYASLKYIGKPKEGETIFVSAAAGFVGQLVGQIAKIKGLRVVGSAGSDEKKVDYLLNELKFDAAFNYNKVELDKALYEYCPNGIDIYYENVGGETLEVVLNHCNLFARIVACEKYGVKTLENIVTKRLYIQGFVVTDYIGTDIEKEYEKEIIEWIKSGKIIYKETIFDGIENVAKGFVNMLNGKNIGKYIVKLADY